MIPISALSPVLNLNPREAKFCEYIADGESGAEAVRKAGYESKTPGRYAMELKAKPKIREEIMRQVAEREGYVKVDESRVLKEFMTIVNSDISDFIDEDGYLFSPEVLKDLPPHKTKAIQSIKQRILKDGSVETEVRMYDKLNALDKVARHVNFYQDEDDGKKQPIVNLVLPGALLNIS